MIKIFYPESCLVMSSDNGTMKLKKILKCIIQPNAFNVDNIKLDRSKIFPPFHF